MVSEVLDATVREELKNLELDPNMFADYAGRTVAPPYEPAPELAVESRVEVGATLGQGGMGIVRLGVQRALDRPVAIKSLRPDRQTANARAKLLSEAQLTGRLEHPNVVPVHDIVEEDGELRVILKRIEGVPWLDVIEAPEDVSRRFGTDDVEAWHVRIALSVCDALRYAHSRGIVHRDVKPENVMIGAFGEVYLLDWGIAVSVVEDGRGNVPLARDAQGLAGTPHYMAPEMLGGRGGEIGPRTDIYLLGATLHHALGGTPPHECETLRDALDSIAQSKPRLPATVHGEVFSIIRRAMHAEPDDRFASIEEMAGSLRAYLSHRGSRALAQDAEARAEALRSAISSQDEATPRTVAALYGESAFGFRSALREWPNNEHAQTALDGVTADYARYMLSVGDPTSASRALEQAGRADAKLKDEIARALERQAHERAEVERVSQLFDRDAGGGWRLRLGLAAGLFFSCLPLVGLTLDLDRWGWRAHAFAAGLLVGSLLAMTLAWSRVPAVARRTMINRTMAVGTLCMLVPQLFAHLGDALAGVTFNTTLHHSLLVWGGVTGVATILTNRWMMLPAFTYLTAFVAVALFPDTLFIAASIGNMSVVAAFLLWRKAEGTGGLTV